MSYTVMKEYSDMINYGNMINGQKKKKKISTNGYVNNANGFYLLLRFKMKKGRQFCARPEEKWVLELINKIDKKFSLKKQKYGKRKQ